MKSDRQMISIQKVLPLLLLLCSISACDDLLDVDDPGAIRSEDLVDPQMEELIVHGVLSEFQFAYNSMLLSASIFSDELYTDHTNIDHREFALLNFDNTNALNNGAFTNLQKARVAAEDAVDRLTEFHGNESSSSVNVAIAHAYAGYSYVLLGEHFCQAPVDVGAPLTSAELLAAAVDHFEEAIEVAGRATGTGAGGMDPQLLLNLAHLGAARASLQMGEMQQAIAHANEVEEDFEEYVYRSSNSSREQNIIGVQWATTGQWLSVAPAFQFLDDPRVRHLPEPGAGLNARDIFVPFRPYSYEGWNPEDEAQTVTTSTHVRFASSLEARYIVAEAAGPTAETLEFVNERRAVGRQEGVSLSGDELMEELREQRARDFFMSVQRHGDLRRYIDLYGIDLFPTGTYPVTSEPYGDARCFIIPLSESSGNPNV
jgi:tetratricopeptide (TPR) repeat protein